MLTTDTRSVRVRTQDSRFEGGFSLVELLVGMLVSLICVLAMMAAFAAFEGPKRTTTSGDDAQQNGSYSLYELERQIRTAGSGFTQGENYGVWGCSIAGYYSSSQTMPSTQAFPIPFDKWPQSGASLPIATLAMPVLIASGGADGSGNALPDIIAIAAGNPAGTVFKSTIQSTPDASTVVLDNALGIYANDYLLATTTAGNCVMGMAATITAASNQVSLSAANSPSSGFIGGKYVFDLGAQPTFSLYGVYNPASGNTSSLVTYDLLKRSGNVTQAISDGIVTIKALYGVDDGATTASIPGSGQANDGIIDEWVAPTGATWGINAILASQANAATLYPQIKAIRLVVVARSQLPERTADYSTGSATLTLFPDLPAALRYTITTQPQYRYKVYDTTIPIHNAIINRWF
jgi:type IV pilus assembly protein PilW